MVTSLGKVYIQTQEIQTKHWSRYVLFLPLKINSVATESLNPRKSTVFGGLREAARVTWSTSYKMRQYSNSFNLYSLTTLYYLIIILLINLFTGKGTQGAVGGGGDL